jgi:ubiquitin C-terminal hydrolase
MCHLLILVDFDNYMQHDAHEFLNFLINDIKETIIGKIILIIYYSVAFSL